MSYRHCTLTGRINKVVSGKCTLNWHNQSLSVCLKTLFFLPKHFEQIKSFSLFLKRFLTNNET